MKRWFARPVAVRLGNTRCWCASTGTRPDQISATQTETSRAAARRARLRDSAANGSAHRMYHGISQLTQTTASRPPQPAGVIQLRLRQATTAHTARPENSATVMKRRTAASAPPCPVA